MIFFDLDDTLLDHKTAMRLAAEQFYVWDQVIDAVGMKGVWMDRQGAGKSRFSRR